MGRFPAHEAEALIDARGSTVWDIITDGGNYPVWDSGITDLEGDLRHGGAVRVKARGCGNRAFRLSVRLTPGEVMVWTGGLPLGLLTVVRIFRLTPDGGKTLLSVRQEFRGPLLGPWRELVAAMAQAPADYVSAVKTRAELLGRHEARILAALARPRRGSGEHPAQPRGGGVSHWPGAVRPHGHRLAQGPAPAAVRAQQPQ